jgi:hypothetical protein
MNFRMLTASLVFGLFTASVGQAVIAPLFHSQNVIKCVLMSDSLMAALHMDGIDSIKVEAFSRVTVKSQFCEAVYAVSTTDEGSSCADVKLLRSHCI